MAEKITIYYDEEGDNLDLFIGPLTDAQYDEIEEDLFVRLDDETKRVVGFMLMNFTKRFKQQHKAEIPLAVEFVESEG